MKMRLRFQNPTLVAMQFLPKNNMIYINMTVIKKKFEGMTRKWWLFEVFSCIPNILLILYNNKTIKNILSSF